jgi:hypothetical protein
MVKTKNLNPKLKGNTYILKQSIIFIEKLILLDRFRLAKT